ncbi:MAG: HAMP domain-containing protein [Nitrospirota bacterium]|nr:HAMP domain-containing protein [Nitrospirota bacterium]MDE3117716.1 HAMP domain-containing protein [Nitrospirota bacterium]
MILVIVGLSALSAEYIDRRYVAKLAQENFQQEMVAVVRQVGAAITTIAEFHNQPSRELELYKLLASRPDLVEIRLYTLPAGEAGPPSLFVSAGNNVQPKQEGNPILVEQAVRQASDVSDLSGWGREHLLKIAAPILVENRMVGAAYAEFSTAQFDEVLDYQRRLSLTRRLATGAVIVLAINLFLYLKVHRPVRALLAAVESVAHGNMTTAVPVGGGDEIGRLGSRFNTMVKRIRAATEENRKLYDQLQRAHDDLQIKVDEATTEVRQKIKELARTNEILSTTQREAARAQRLSAIGQLAATVAHKIGTPLTALSGHIQLLQEDPQLSLEARRRIDTVEAQIERTSRIIQDLLLYARKPELTVVPLNLNECLEECVALLRPEIDRRGVVPVLALSPDLDKVQADPQQLQEVFCNLIENALDAMPTGGTLTIRSGTRGPTTAGSAGRRAAVEVEDTGEGIPREVQAQIFQPFFTTKKAGRGTGLGLAIALETVRAHGGQISVESEAGKGSRFLVLLPLSDGADRC